MDWNVITDYLRDKTISDICIMAPDKIKLRKNGKSCLCNTKFSSANAYQMFVQQFKTYYRINQLFQCKLDESQSEDYVLKITYVAAECNYNNFSHIYIRKIPKRKNLRGEL